PAYANRAKMVDELTRWSRAHSRGWTEALELYDRLAPNLVELTFNAMPSTSAFRKIANIAKSARDAMRFLRILVQSPQQMAESFLQSPELQDLILPRHFIRPGVRGGAIFALITAMGRSAARHGHCSWQGRRDHGSLRILIERRGESFLADTEVTKIQVRAGACKSHPYKVPSRNHGLPRHRRARQHHRFGQPALPQGRRPGGQAVLCGARRHGEPAWAWRWPAWSPTPLAPPSAAPRRRCSDQGRAGRPTDHGEDKANDTADHVAKLRALNVTPHVTQYPLARGAARARSTPAPHRIRATACRNRAAPWSNASSAGASSAASLRKTKHRRIGRVAANFMLNLIAYNLIRIPKLVAA
ncbi:MAG: hypothetical protein QOF09_3616, partial [Alphaproteobacteria bacterium]|nr:hypothetical protein [Alphaproteobacteria bacterium]